MKVKTVLLYCTHCGQEKEVEVTQFEAVAIEDPARKTWMTEPAYIECKSCRQTFDTDDALMNCDEWEED